MIPVLQDTGLQSWSKIGQKKIQIVQICSMTSDKAIYAIRIDIRPLSREIQALRVAKNAKENRKISNCPNLLSQIWQSHICHRN